MRGYVELHSKVYFQTSEEGGRETPAFSGYKPSIFFGKQGTLSIIYIEGKKEDELVPPGKRYDARIILLHRRELINELKPGRSFELREGLKVVAEGIIEQIQYLEE
jgi:elongation factor Tu